MQQTNPAAVGEYLRGLQQSIIAAVEAADGGTCVRDAWQKEPGVDQLPGHGPTDFRPWLRALAKANYRWYVNPFMHGEVEPEAMSAALAKARDYLKQRART